MTKGLTKANLTAQKGAVLSLSCRNLFKLKPII